MATLRERLARFAMREASAGIQPGAEQSACAPASASPESRRAAGNVAHASTRSPSRPQIEELEPRLLFSIDLPALQGLQDAAATLQPAALERIEPAALGLDTPEASAGAEHERREIVFLDTGVEGYQGLLDDLRSRGDASLEIVLLDAERDGVEQISEALGRLSPGFDAVHIVSHGTDAGVRLGASWLTAESLGGYTEALRGWSGALTADADLLFYGCDLAASEAGRSLVADLATLTGADVAASIDATGAAALGGDWDLEHRQGRVETSLAFGAEARAAFVGVLDGTAIWNPNGSATPQANDFSAGTFGVAAPTSNVGGPWRILTGAEAPHRDEIIVVGLDSSNNVSGQIWNGASWTALPFNDMATGLSDGAWSFAVAYETQTGNAMLVYSDGSNGNTALTYRIWDGASWSGPSAITAPESGEPEHLRLAAAPDSNEMVLVVSNDDEEDYALVWDGASWGNGITLDDGTGAPDSSEVGVVYEQQSGDAMVVYGDSSDNAQYRIWNGSSWSSENTLTRPGGVSGALLWTSLAADPSSDDIVLGVVTANSDTWLAAWDGASWGPAQVATTNAATTNAPNVAVAFESTTGHALAVYGDSGSTSARYQIWNGVAWSGDLAGPGLGEKATSVLLAAEPGTDDVMLAVQDDAANLSYVLWDGTAWGAPDQQEADTGETGYQPFTFLWDQSNTAPVLTPAGPALNPVSSRSTGGAGQLISTFLGSSISDVDPGAREGIAINSLVSGSGTWEYSVDGGASWVAIGGVSDAGALLLRDSDRIRFTPSGADSPDSASISYRAWDQTFGSAGSKFDVSTNGGSTAYSSGAADTATLAVTNANSGVAIWGQAGTAMPEVNSFDGAAFGTSGLSSSVAGPWRYVDVAHAPTRIEQIAVGADASGTLSGQLWDGTSWTALPFNNLATLSVSSRGFAVAYEQQSGDLLLVYANGTTGASPLSYRVWDGATWSGATTIAAPYSGEAQNLRIAAKPDSDELVLVASNATNQDFALVWDGSAWGNAVALHDGTGALSNTDVHVVYEQQSGDAMLVYGRNTANAYFRIWNGSFWSAEATITAPGGADQAVWAQLAADPTSDRIALGVVTASSGSWLAIWDGGAWQVSQTATAASPSSSFISIDVAFESDTGTAVAVYAKGSDSTLYYRTASGSAWSAEQAGPTVGGFARNLQLDADPGSDAIMLGAHQTGSDLTYSLWDGSAWILVSTQETNLSSATSEPFAFLWEPETEAADSLLITTKFSVSGGGQPGTDTWQDGDLIAFGDPNLSLEPGTTNGTFTVPFDIDIFAPGAILNGGIHYVSRDIQVGASSFQLLEGDLLLATDSAETLTSTSTPVGPFTNNLTVGQEDVFVFRPDVAGNYGAGTFAMLLDDVAGPGAPGPHVHGITLVEQDTWVGDKLVNAGDFLFLRSSPGSDEDVWLFETIDVGAGNTSATISTLLEATDAGISIEDKLNGIELIETATTLGNRILPAGSLLLEVGSASTVGANDLSATPFDIFVLDVTATTLVAGAGNAYATASLLFEGGEVGFDTAASEEIYGISMFPANEAPVLTPAGPSLTSITEDETSNAGELISSIVGSSIEDEDANALEGIAVTNLVSGNGTWQYDAGTGWTDVGVVSNANALLLRATDKVRFVPDGDNGELVSFDFRAWDQTQGLSGTKVDASVNGGITAFSTASDTASLTVTDLNDSPSATGFTTGLAENSANGTAVGSATATDVDTGANGTLTYAITAGNTSGAFTINASTGAITVANDAALDFEATPTFNLTVRTTDGGSLTDTAAVTVNLSDVNEVPTVSGGPYGVAENSPNGTAVGTVSGSDPDAGANGTLTYAITAGNTNGAFAINTSSGAITVANDAALNFEATPTFNLTVRTTDGGSLTDTAAVTVNLSDVNEVPTVSGGPYGVAENSANGTAVGTVAGSDPDAGANGTLTYAITAGNTNGAFTINTSSGAITVANDAALNFETTPTFNLTVRTTDGGSLTDTAAVTVNLSDVNEVPTVSGGPYGLAENSANGTAVGTVSGSDPDAGANGTLTYAITAGNTNGAFSINTSSGAITVANDAALNFEATPTFNLTVRTTDGGSLTDTAAVTVNLSDVNEVPTVSGGPYGVAENSPNGTAVGTVSGSDPDAGANGTLTYAITAGNTNGAFAINTSSGAITVANDAALNFEATPTFNLTVRTTDGGSLTDTAAVTVNLSDVNEVPTVSGGPYGVAENSANGTAVGTVAGSDPDAGANGALTYAITAGNTNGAFTINTSSGAITVANDAALNFETTPTFNLTVRTTDGGSLTDTAAVTVNLSDVNEVPTVSGGPYGVAENSANGTAVGTVSGSDPDAGANGTLTYAITAGNTNGAFTINTSSGAITVANDAALNFETTPTFNLTVRTTDGGSLTDTAAVTVNLSDVNEQPTAGNATFGVVELSANGTAVGTVLALDPDAGANGTLTYAITAGNTNGAFSINTSSGAITVANDAALNFEATPTFNLTVRTTDGGSLTDTAAVTVNLSDVNEVPTVSGGPYGVAENSANGTAVGTVAGSDPDAGANGTLTYAITAGNTNGAFTINTSSGAITVANDAALNFETTPTFNLTVRTTDGGSLTDTAAVTVNLSDVNEQPTAGNATFGVVELSANGTAVGTVLALDPDAGANGTLTYAITAGNTNGAFTINTSSGAITVANQPALDFETTPTFNLTVRTTDGGSLTDTAAVTVNLSDDNEKPTTTGFTTGLAEKSANGTAVGTVSSSDPDAGANGVLTYAITGGNTNGAFAINTGTGAITVANDLALDFESTPSFNLVVVATDGGGLTDGAIVTVNLSDANEPPTATGFATILAENTANGTLAGSASGSDPDAGVKGQLTYAISAGNTGGAFSINASSGSVTVANATALDFESTPSFSLTVRVTDGEGLTDTAAVSIGLSDQNELPSLSGGPYSLAENSANGTAVGSVSGSDLDAGANGVLTYAITGGNTSGAFAINSASGAITVANDGALDFETTPTFNLTVRATDGGGLSDTAAVTVNLADANESPSATGFTTGLVENSPNGTAVGSATGSDPDAGANGTLTYAITAGNTSGAFAINASTGDVTVANQGALDFETTPTFNLTVRSTDGGGLTDTAAVTVNLSDGNELPTATGFTAGLVENSANGTAVGSVSGSDSDPGANGTLTYAITAGNTSGAFAINSSTGAVTVANQGALDFEITPGFNLTVRTTDGGGLTDTAAVTVNLSDVNESPSVTGGPFGLAENSPNGSLVSTATASDPDAGANGTLTYAITAGNTNGAFSINASSGAVTVANQGALDFETTPTFNLTVRATDGGGLTDTAVISVNLSDQNDAPVLAAGAPSLPPLTEDQTGNSGERISTLLGATVSDADAGALEGIAVTTIFSGNGQWQYSTNAGASWTALTSASDASALLLRDIDRIRFVPDAANATSASFDYRAWDRSAGTAEGSTANTTSSGGGTPYSTAKNTASVSVSGLNDAPTLADASLPAPPSGMTNPPGRTLAVLFAGAFGDVDAGASFAGVAVVKNTADPVTQGSWQYSSDGGASWFAIGSVSDGATALTLDVGTRVRFLPVTGYSGTPPSLQMRGLDDSYAGGFSSTAGAIETRANVDSSVNGGTAPISGGVTTLSTGLTTAPPPTPSPTPDPTPAPEPTPEPEPEPSGEDDPPAAEDLAAPGSHSSGTPTPPAPELPPAPPPAPPELPPPAPPAPSIAPESEDLLRAVVEHYSPAVPESSADTLQVQVFEDRRVNFLDELDKVRDELEAPMRIEARVVGSAVAMTTGLSVGYVVWLTRGGLLLASLISSMPAWRIIDPLPVLARFAEESEADQETLESMIQQSDELEDDEIGENEKPEGSA